MKKLTSARVRYLCVSLISASALIFAACQENTITSSADPSGKELQVGTEQALDQNISAQIAGANARIEEFQLMSDESASSVTGKQKTGLFVIHPGESIQAAVDAADPGATLLIKPGIYSEAVSITKSGITLIGLGGLYGEEVVIRNPGDEEDGIRVGPATGFELVDGFAMYNITVRDFEENGVFLIRTQNYFIAKVTTINDGEYGIFPVRSNNGIIFNSSAEGHTDAGIYIGQSTGGWILNCESYGNVLGFEVENSSDIIVAHNFSYDNTIGILAVLLPPISPFLTVFESDNVVLAHNRVYNNNLDNFAEPGEIASFIPKGMGVMLVGVNNSRVFRNRITDNDLIGLGVGSTRLFGALADLPPEVFEAIDPDPDNVEIIRNKVLNNGTNPPPLPAPLTGIESDLFWDGSGDNNCWWDNDFITSFPAELPQCPSPGL